MAENEASKLTADVDSCQIDTHSVSDSKDGMERNLNQNEGTKPQSYLIFDTETTGLQGVYGNPRITELCLMAVHRDDLFEDGVKIPRVVNKLQLCVNPEKFITPGSSQITGLFNDALERQLPFNRNIFSIIHSFIQAQAQPPCLIAHNGNKFDYLLLASELKRVGEKLPQGLLCADSLDALRELDADPEGQSSHVGGQSSHVRGQSPHGVINHTLRDRAQSSNCEVNVKETWNITEVTPVKRRLLSETASSEVLKKPKKDAVKESKVDNIHREKVARKLEYIPPNSINEIGITNTQTYSKSNTPNEIQKESENNSSHGSEDTINQESLSNKIAFDCKTNLSDEDLMVAVHHMETNRPSNIRPEDLEASVVQPGISSDRDANQNHTHPLSKHECDLYTPDRSNTILSKQPLGSKPGGALPNGSIGCFQASNKESSPNGKFGHYIDESRSEKSANSQGTLPNSSYISVSLSASGSNKECSPSTEPVLHGHVGGSKSEMSTIPNQTASLTNYNQLPALVSEKTVIYHFDQPNMPKTELNSQGSMPDDDFLVAVEEMETSGDKETTCIHKTNIIPQPSSSDSGRKSVNDREAGAGKHGNAESTTNTKTSCEGNSTNQVISSVVRKPNVNSCDNFVDNGQGCLSRSNIQKSPFTGNTTSTNGKRKSFRLPDIYKRHFGNQPSTSHTAEDDCRTLLKIVKKFSPKFLEWVDEHCVPFDSVRPMY